MHLTCSKHAAMIFGGKRFLQEKDRHIGFGVDSKQLGKLLHTSHTFCLIGSPIPKNVRFGRFERPAEPSAPKGRRCGRLWGDSRFHLGNSENETNLLALIR